MQTSTNMAINDPSKRLVKGSERRRIKNKDERVINKLVLNDEPVREHPTINKEASNIINKLNNIIRIQNQPKTNNSSYFNLFNEALNKQTIIIINKKKE